MPSASWLIAKNRRYPVHQGDPDCATAEPRSPQPYTYMRYKAKNKGDEDKISQALAKMMEEDLTLKSVNDSENRQTLLYGMGDQHLDVVVSKLVEKFKVSRSS